MYDPLIVDAFIGVYKDIAPQETDRSTTASNTFSLWGTKLAKAEFNPSGARLEDIAASTEETLALYDLAKALSGDLNLAEIANVIASHTRRVVPASTAAFYSYDEDSDELVCAHTTGEGSGFFLGLRIARGQRLTGWVAANERTIVNSDPVLDLGEVARSVRPRLRSCLSTPLLSGHRLLGVLTLYSTQQNAFDENHRRIIEAVARQAADRVAQVLKSSRVESTDALGGLPNRQQLQRFLRSELGEARGSSNLSLIFVSVAPDAKSSAGFQEPSGRVIEAIRRVLRDGDILFRYGRYEFVVLLARTDGVTATRLVATMTTSLSSSIDGSRDAAQAVVAVAFGTATAPSDGTTAEDLVRMARSRVVQDATSSPDTGLIH